MLEDDLRTLVSRHDLPTASSLVPGLPMAVSKYPRLSSRLVPCPLGPHVTCVFGCCWRSFCCLESAPPLPATAPVSTLYKQNGTFHYYYAAACGAAVNIPFFIRNLAVSQMAGYYHMRTRSALLRPNVQCHNIVMMVNNPNAMS